MSHPLVTPASPVTFFLPPVHTWSHLESHLSHHLVQVPAVMSFIGIGDSELGTDRMLHSPEFMVGGTGVMLPSPEFMVGGTDVMLHNQ